MTNTWKIIFIFFVAILSVELSFTFLSIDIVEYFFLLLIFPACLVFVLVGGILWKKCSYQTAAVIAVIYVLTAWVAVKWRNDFRTNLRWLIEARQYKIAVLSGTSPNGQLKHIEWDGWGFAGSDTTVYLVLDPNDSLAIASKNRLSGKFAGIPCEVFSVHRLEKNWYTVLFYTNSDWDHCP